MLVDAPNIPSVFLAFSGNFTLNGTENKLIAAQYHKAYTWRLAVAFASGGAGPCSARFRKMHQGFCCYLS